MRQDSIPDAAARRIALALVERCVRKTSLEDLHAGKVPQNATGNFSDVKVVTPTGEIPWNEVSRISDSKMKALMIEVANKVYTFISHLDDLVFLQAASRWDRPEFDPALLTTAQSRAAARSKID